MNFVTDDDLFYIDIFVSKNQDSLYVWSALQPDDSENIKNLDIDHYQFFFRHPSFSDLQQIVEYAALLPVSDEYEISAAIKLCRVVKLLSHYKILNKETGKIIPDVSAILNLDVKILRQIFLNLEAILDKK